LVISFCVTCFIFRKNDFAVSQQNAGWIELNQFLGQTGYYPFWLTMAGIYHKQWRPTPLRIDTPSTKDRNYKATSFPMAQLIQVITTSPRHWTKPRHDRTIQNRRIRFCWNCNDFLFYMKNLKKHHQKWK
jgi:hypothetical protein